VASVRVTLGRRSREPGTEVGVQVNVFGLKTLQGALTGEAMAEILHEAGQIALDDAYAEWPVQTQASRDTLELVTISVANTSARVALQAGGDRLTSDPRNVKHIDYAPFIEFLGTATAAPNIIQRAIYSNDGAIRNRIHALVAERIRSSLSE
jgi:hypothetical protein